MIVARIEGFTRELGKSQGYRGLPIKDDKLEDGTPMMLSAWEPTPLELAILNAGGKIVLSVIGSAHPPVSLNVMMPTEVNP
jgi:hypothetical protein